ncbi:MAG: hypothetical protein ACR2LR_06050 [Hassallia sp.]
MNISLKSASRGLTVVASLLCLGGVMSFVKSKQPLAINIIIASASVVISSEFVSRTNHNQANNQLAEIVAKHNKDWQTLNIEYQQQTRILKETQTLRDELQQSFSKASDEVILKSQTIQALQANVNRLVAEFESKTEELDLKLQSEDMRYQELITAFKSLVVEHLSERIYSFFNSLNESVEKKLESEDYQAIHENLRPFKDKLQHHYDTHCELLNNIRDIDGELADIVTDVLNVYSRIVDEQTALKVRFKNLLNLDERRSLEDAYTFLADIDKTHTPIAKAKDLLGEYRDFNKNQLNNLGDKLEDNVNSLEEMRSQVFDLIAQIEQISLEKLTLKQQLDEAKKPQQFYGGSTIAVAGNKISQYYYKKGYKLDCITWEETTTGYFITYGIRDNPALTEKELFADNSREQLAAYSNALHGTLPTLIFNYQNCTLILTVQLRSTPKKVVTPQEQVEEIRAQLRPSESLIDFVNQAYHVGMWGETGKGKTTAISNTIGGMIQGLGAPIIRTTIPKIDADSAKLFPTCDWLGVPNSIFGMLEAALEIQYRIWVNEQAYLKGEEVKDFEPILFFIDEINLIFSRWKKVVDADMDDVLERFAATLSGERLNYFTNYMQLELRNYKNEFAKRLLMFIWQTGRSLRVKSLIAGQNLQPGALGLMVNDLANCAYIAFGDSKDKCTEYKVKSSDLGSIKEQLNLVEKAANTDSNLQFTGLFCPSVGSAFLSVLPTPNTYIWDKSLLSPKSPKSVDKASDYSDTGLETVRDSLTLDSNNSNGFQAFSQMDKLSKPYQNLGYEGLVQLWSKLPKKVDGSIHKTQAYEKMFKVSNSTHRKIYSDFIDYLESLCK